MAMDYLKSYKQFESVHEMDQHVQQHIHKNFYELTKSTRKVLLVIASHALRFPGAAHLKIETIATKINVSEKTVNRAIKSLVEKSIIGKRNRTKKNGIKGANVYFILPCVPSNVPSEMSERANNENPCDIKDEQTIKQAESFNSFKQNLNNNNKNTYAPHAVDNGEINKVDKEPFAQPSLYTRIKGVLSKRNSIEQLSEFARIAYGSVKKVCSLDSRIPRKQAEDIAFNHFTNVIESKSARNVFAVFSAKMREVVNLLAGKNEHYTHLELAMKQGKTSTHTPSNRPRINIKEQAPDWMDTDYTKYTRRELVPDWMAEGSDAASPSKENSTIDFEAERLAILAKLGM